MQLFPVEELVESWAVRVGGWGEETVLVWGVSTFSLKLDLRFFLDCESQDGAGGEWTGCESFRSGPCLLWEGEATQDGVDE